MESTTVLLEFLAFEISILTLYGIYISGRVREIAKDVHRIAADVETIRDSN